MKEKRPDKETHQMPPSHHHTNWISICGCLFLCLTASFLKYLEANVNIPQSALFRENSWVENLTAVWLFLGGVFLFATASMERQVFQRRIYRVGGVALIFAAGEELSWGQHMFGYPTPDILVEYNQQLEFNLHNSGPGLNAVHRQILEFGTASLCIMSVASFFYGKKRMLGIPLPSMPLTLALLVGLFYTPRNLRIEYFLTEEIGLIWSISFIFVLLSGQCRLILVIVTTMISALTLFVVNSLDIYAINLQRGMEAKEYLIAFGYCWYCLELFWARTSALRKRGSRFRGRRWRVLFVKRVQLSYLMPSCFLVICVSLGCSHLARQHFTIKAATVNHTLEALRTRAPIIRSQFDVYIVGNEIVYFKDPCPQEHLAPPFFLHVTPATRNGAPLSYLFFSFQKSGGRVYKARQTSGPPGVACLMRVPLPEGRIVQVWTGQWSSWEGAWPSAINNYEAAYSSVVSKSPHIRSNFDVRLSGNMLIYTKEPCVPSDTDAPFFLHVYPSDKQNSSSWVRHYGFDNQDFSFSDRGKIFNDKCMAVVELFRSGINRIVTGQFTPEGRPWEVHFPFPGLASLEDVSK